MNRLRAIFREQVLPFVIGALVLRALIPVGFMPGPGSNLSLAAMLCAPPGLIAGTELIEIPGGMPASGHSHCDFCGLPMLGALPVDTQLASPDTIESTPVPSRVDAPHSRFALERAQTPRAPPRA